MSKRKDFLKLAGLSSLVIAGRNLLPLSAFTNSGNKNLLANFDKVAQVEKDVSVIGLYGPWANELNKNNLQVYHYKHWLKELNLAQLNVNLYKKTLLEFCNQYEKNN